MSEYLELGPTPYDEPCYPTGKENYEVMQNREMRAYVHQLERMFPEGDFRIKRFPHDFGSYGEVVIRYQPGCESEELAYKVESELPRKWDEEAVKELSVMEVA